MPTNIEIKAHCADIATVRSVLAARGARRVGLDHQVDTYFNVPSGRLKLRSGDIENNLIFYRRPDGAAPKRSHVRLLPCSDPVLLTSLLTEALGVRCVVDKQREIYFHGHVKFHVDEVTGLGNFIEIEVIEMGDDVDEPAMLSTCHQWMTWLNISDDDLIATSYSDMLNRSV